MVRHLQHANSGYIMLEIVYSLLVIATGVYKRNNSFMINIMKEMSEIITRIEILANNIKIYTLYSVSQKIPPPYGFLKFFPKRLGIFNQFLHTYYVIISTLDYKFLFNYLQL